MGFLVPLFDGQRNHQVMAFSPICRYIGKASDLSGVLFGLALGIFLLVAMVGCSSSQLTTPVYETCSSSEPTEDYGLTILVGSTDLIVGENRLVFALMDKDAEMVKRESIDLSFSCALESGVGFGSTDLRHTTGVLREWPYDRFVYTTQVSFHKPGIWSMEASTKTSGNPLRATVLLHVAEKGSTPIKGSQAPRSASKIFDGVTTLEQITTDPVPDVDLYSLTIADALEVGKPLVVTFASPAFCMSITCGPQVRVIKETKTEYIERVNFIHVEVFDNPIEMREDGGKGRLSPIMIEWGLQSEPYTFVMDSQGYVYARFEGFVAGDELRDAIEGTFW